MRNDQSAEGVVCPFCEKCLPVKRFSLGKNGSRSPICMDCSSTIRHHRNKDFVVDYLEKKSQLVMTDMDDREQRLEQVRKIHEKVKRIVKRNLETRKNKSKN